jgi:hypothetical protein
VKHEGVSRQFLIAELLADIHQVMSLYLVVSEDIYLSDDWQEEIHLLVRAALRILFQDLYHRLKKFKPSNCLP